MYLLFYSKKCKYSNKFIELLSHIGEEKFFKMVEVVKTNGKFPTIVKKYGITEVPTAYINGQMYAGPKAFKWLERKIKNVNHQVSSQDTRMNKTPVISGYIPETNSFSLQGDSLQGTNSFSVLNMTQKIETPDAGTDYEKTPFMLPNDQITGGCEIKEDRIDRKSKIDSDLEKLLQERENDIKRKY
jgi:glutaredoxin-related protein